jgi:cobalt/nickel transport system permease protein
MMPMAHDSMLPAVGAFVKVDAAPIHNLHSAIEVPLLAVHISDGVLSPIYLIAGFVVAGLFFLPSVLRIQDDEIPRIGLLTAAFFVASSIHVRVGPGSVHLLLNGLVGIVLGRRAPLAIAVALVLQALLLGHGGFTTLGVNAVIMTLPALLAAIMFRSAGGPQSPKRAIWVGSLTGAATVLITAAMYAVVLIDAGVEEFRIVAGFGFAIHIPLAAIEGLIVGVAAGYLARVKPEMLAGDARNHRSLEPLPRSAEAEPERVISSQSQTSSQSQ